MRKIFRILFFLMITGLFLSNYSGVAISVPAPNSARAQAEKTSERKYRLPGHGFLELSVPESWKDEVRQPPFELPPTITMRSGGADDSVLIITPLWNQGGENNFNSDGKVRQIMEQEIQAMKARSAEEELVLNPIKGPEAYGYYYMATDKAPKPDEWEYALRAGVVCHELLISATLLTHDKSSPAVGATLEALRSVRQITEGELRMEEKFDFRYPPKIQYDADCAPPTHEQKMWALATFALITEYNGGRHDLLGGYERIPEEINDQRRSLAEWWGVHSRSDLIDALQWIEEGGHRKGFDEIQQYIKSPSSEEKAAFLEHFQADPELNNKLNVVTSYPVIWGDKGIIGWDYARYTALCGWGYIAGYFTEEEAWTRMMPAARLLQQTFDSWEDLGANYLFGREFWSLDESEKHGGSMGKAFKKLRTEAESPWKTIPWNLDLTQKQLKRTTKRKAQ